MPAFCQHLVVGKQNSPMKDILYTTTDFVVRAVQYLTGFWSSSPGDLVEIKYRTTDSSRLTLKIERDGTAGPPRKKR